MMGKYTIELYNNRVHYFLTVQRNITVIQGETATGKTELIRLLTLYRNNGASSGITLLCERTCAVLDNTNWKSLIKESQQCILFADEGCSFLNTQEFAEAIRGSDNYYVLVTRENLSQLPYSILEIYGMRLNDSIRYHNARRIYNELYQFYGLKENLYTNPSEHNPEDTYIDCVLTEDSNSGYDFYHSVSQVPVESAAGKSRILSELQKNKDKNILVIADGAAFGPEIGKVISYLRDTGRRVDLYAPESFEYLLLKADIIDHTSSVTADPYQYADSRLYMSWEEFFTAYLRQKSQNTIYHYTKKNLNPAWLTEGNRKKILKLLPESVIKDLESRP